MSWLLLDAFDKVFQESRAEKRLSICKQEWKGIERVRKSYLGFAKSEETAASHPQPVKDYRVFPQSCLTKRVFSHSDLTATVAMVDRSFQILPSFGAHVVPRSVSPSCSGITRLNFLVLPHPPDLWTPQGRWALSKDIFCVYMHPHSLELSGLCRTRHMLTIPNFCSKSSCLLDLSARITNPTLDIRCPKWKAHPSQTNI